MSSARQPGRPGPTYLVECYWPGVTVTSFTDAVRRLDASVASLRRDGHAIEAVAATLVPSDEAAYWIVDAPSAEVVAEACAHASLRVERVVAALDLGRRRGLRAMGPGPSGRRPVPAGSAADSGPEAARTAAGRRGVED